MALTKYLLKEKRQQVGRLELDGKCKLSTAAKRDLKGYFCEGRLICFTTRAGRVPLRLRRSLIHRSGVHRCSYCRARQNEVRLQGDLQRGATCRSYASWPPISSLLPNQQGQPPRANPIRDRSAFHRVPTPLSVSSWAQEQKPTWTTLASPLGLDIPLRVAIFHLAVSGVAHKVPSGRTRCYLCWERPPPPTPLSLPSTT